MSVKNKFPDPVADVKLVPKVAYFAPEGVAYFSPEWVAYFAPERWHTIVRIIQQPFNSCISPFDITVKQVSGQTAFIRNKMMMQLADEITIGYASEGEKPEKLLKTMNKEITRLI